MNEEPKNGADERSASRHRDEVSGLDRRAVDSRIDELLDARRDPLDDSALVPHLAVDLATLERVVALRAALAALPFVVAERSKRRTVLERTTIAAAAAALIGITLLLARTKAPSEAPADAGVERRPRVLAFHQTTTTRGADRICVEERDRFGVVRRIETENSPALQLVRTETRSRP